jgi:two-component system NtrC family sensor kinase
MKQDNQVSVDRTGKLLLNLAIVGGGQACKFFLEFLQNRSFRYIDINIIGVCDLNLEAPGIRLAQDLGIYTTKDFRDIFAIQNLDGVIEFTGNQEVLLDLIRRKPEGLWVLDHNIAGLLQDLSILDEKLKLRDQDASLEKMISEFLLHHANERIVVLDPDFTIIEANEAYLKAVARPRKEVVGEHCYEITHGFSSPCSQWEPEMGCPLVDTLKTGQSSHAIHEHAIDGKKLTYCDLETFPIKTAPDGNTVRVIEIWRDITEELSSRLDRRFKELKTNLGKLVQEDRLISLGKLSASCVHEINNPIQGLLTFSSLMQSILAQGPPTPGDLEQFKEYLDLMSSELERCGSIVSGLLSFARESGMELKDVELNEIIRSVVTLTRNKMEIQDIRLRVELSTEPLMVRGDVNQLQQCFLNVIFNAIEAMPGGGRLSVTSRLDGERKWAEVIMEDSGCGIPEKNLGSVFDPFFTTKEEGEGTGLGLSIVYGVVKSHEGHIEIESEEGAGSTFILRFPVHSNVAKVEDAADLRRRG